jgi:hypothetical protein
LRTGSFRAGSSSESPAGLAAFAGVAAPAPTPIPAIKTLFENSRRFMNFSFVAHPRRVKRAK